VAHVLALFHSGTGLLLRVVASSMRTRDLRHAAGTHPELQEGDILLADQGFASFAHLALLFLRQMHAVFRCHQKQIVLRFLTPQRGYRTRVITVVTTLLDPVAYPKEAIADLYLSRWQIEVNFRHLKTTMGTEVLHCKSREGVLKDPYIFALAYNLVRLVMLEASRPQEVPLDRISFIDALRWLRDAKADTKLTPLVVNPYRPDRLDVYGVEKLNAFGAWAPTTMMSNDALNMKKVSQGCSHVYILPPSG
jgi:hypothetical protein